MKWIVSIILVLLSQYALCCECVTIPFNLLYQKTDFIAKAKIIYVDTSEQNNQYRDIEIEILSLYKGQPTTALKINNHLNNDCGIYTPKNSIWLIFASYDINGILHFGICSGSIQIDKYKDLADSSFSKKYHERYLNRRLEVLEFLKNKEFNFVDKYDLMVNFDFPFLQDLKGFDVKSQIFAVYELTIRKDLSVKEVKPIMEFDNADLSNKMFDQLKTASIRTRWVKEIPKETKKLLIFFYYPAESGYKSFISVFAL